MDILNEWSINIHELGRRFYDRLKPHRIDTIAVRVSGPSSQ